MQYGDIVACLQCLGHCRRHRRSPDLYQLERRRCVAGPFEMGEIHRPDGRYAARKGDALRLDELMKVLAIHLVGRQYQLRSEEHTSELQSLMRISYAVFCLKKKKSDNIYNTIIKTTTITE